MATRKPQVVIVTPALSDANNGNWRTAWRWARFLTGTYRCRLVREWPDAGASDDAAMIALHARRSAASVAAWHAARGGRRLGLVLTGTDLYRDIVESTDAQASLDFARFLVTLQERGPLALPEQHRPKARVIFQSSPARSPVAKTGRHLRAIMVGHLREEKSPHTLMEAARLLDTRHDILIDHVGGSLEPALAQRARQAMAANPRYRWLGNLDHAVTRRRIQRAHVLVHCSRMEGGAQVILEAIRSGTPVIASRIEGNTGMLGADYGGYFPCNDAEALARRLIACRESQGVTDGLLDQLARQCDRRAPLFAPALEREQVRQLVSDLLTDP